MSVKEQVCTQTGSWAEFQSVAVNFISCLCLGPALFDEYMWQLLISHHGKGNTIYFAGFSESLTDGKSLSGGLLLGQLDLLLVLAGNLFRLLSNMELNVAVG